MRKVSIQELRHMKDKEGLVLQGCGGDLQEWENGVNDILTKQNILLDGTRFKNVMFFQHENLTNLLFPFEDVEINIGKLSMWRFRHTDSLAVHGCRTMLTTNLAVLWKVPKNLSPTVH